MEGLDESAGDIAPYKTAVSCVHDAVDIATQIPRVYGERFRPVFDRPITFLVFDSEDGELIRIHWQDTISAVNSKERCLVRS
jgi:hypothetical protein